MILRLASCSALLCGLLAGAAGAAEEAEIRVELSGPALPVTRTMTGACIEDVNHEIYGGLDSQLLFGESFQEPAPPPPLKDVEVFGGQWQPGDGIVRARNGGPGPRLISTAAAAATGRVGVDIRFPAGGGGNGALLINVGALQTVGADAFDGYEIALRPGVGLSIGRHHHDYHALGEVPCPVAVASWIRLEVRFGEHGFEVMVDGRSLFSYADKEPLKPGTVGLRIWDRDAEFRGWWRETPAGRQELPIAAEDAATAWRQTGVSGMWRGLSEGSATGSFAEVTQAPFAGKRSQRISFTAGAGGIGIENRGLHRGNLAVRAGKPYDGFVYLRCATALPRIVVAVQDAAGTRTVAQAELAAGQAGAGDGGWQRYDFTLTPEEDVHEARFALILRQPGTVEVGYAFLQPGAWGRFKGLPVRKDVVEGLLAQGITVLRYGGSMVNDAGYRWKNMSGPREFRPPSHGTWYAHSSNGWAIPDFLNLCEAMGVMAIPAINVDEDPRDLADLLDYADGPADGPGGRRRAADGHPQPYHLEHLELGNEEHIDDAYVARFTALAETAWATPRPPLLIVGDFQYSDAVVDPFAITGAAGAPTLAGHQKLLALARAHDREIWFDMHVGTNGIRDRKSIDALPSVIAALTRLADGARFKVAVFELNADNHGVGRALQNAVAIDRFMRLGGQVPVVCSANGLQVDGANDNGWDQGLLFMNAERTWTQPPYHVTRMISSRWLPRTVPATSSHPRLEVTALTSEDGRVVQLNVVNSSVDQAVAARIALPGFAPRSPAALVTMLSGAVGDHNTADQPELIRPVESAWTHGLAQGPATYAFPPLSFTIIRFE
jgi:hypothetical protein